MAGEVSMTIPFVHSSYERIENDHYPTIDKRCVYAFLEHFIPSGFCVDVCSPNGSGIIDTLIECGFAAVGLRDAFAPRILADWVITNPPYKRPLVDDIIRRQIERIENEDVTGIAMLLRANFDFAKTRADLFDSPYYAGQIKMRFRPWWSEDRKAQPIHNYVWQLWTRTALLHQPFVLYASGELVNNPDS